MYYSTYRTQTTNLHTHLLPRSTYSTSTPARYKQTILSSVYVSTSNRSTEDRSVSIKSVQQYDVLYICRYECTTSIHTYIHEYMLFSGSISSRTLAGTARVRFGVFVRVNVWCVCVCVCVCVCACRPRHREHDQESSHF